MKNVNRREIEQNEMDDVLLRDKAKEYVNDALKRNKELLGEMLRAKEQVSLKRGSFRLASSGNSVWMYPGDSLCRF